ncbi:hypothetical protein B0H16DRAFT_1808608 [Mycena metata]|uniref:Uncharacterized protein n=1 Tax=Mycena metata TaxID=1033252 RepID=A0AAD7JES7_9AGAR|nr:hypothetical protein B0H16DRAFT_1808608 [Mycena metata]
MSFDMALPCPFLNSGRFGLSGFSAATLQPRVLGDLRWKNDLNNDLQLLSSRHYYSIRLQERAEGNAAKTRREQVSNTKNWRLKFIHVPIQAQKRSCNGCCGGASREFGTVTSMFKPTIPPSATLYWVGKKWKIILQGLKIAPAEFYVSWVSGMQQNGVLFQLGTRSCVAAENPERPKRPELRKGHGKAVSKDILRQDRKGQVLVRRDMGPICTPTAVLRASRPCATQLSTATASRCLATDQLRSAPVLSMTPSSYPLTPRPMCQRYISARSLNNRERGLVGGGGMASAAKSFHILIPYDSRICAKFCLEVEPDVHIRLDLLVDTTVQFTIGSWNLLRA